jgi:hypothetical protein
VSGKEKILVITYWGYNDALIQTYTLPYVSIIGDMPKVERIFLVTLDKTELKLRSDEPVITNISFLYKKFGVAGALMWIKILITLIRLIKKEKITTIHTWCTPAGAIGYILSLITGKKLILDSFEPHAEAMAEGRTWKPGGIAFRILFSLEKLQLKRATEVICANQGMIEHSQKVYGIKKSRYFVKPACVDLELFSYRNIKKRELIDALQLNDKITCVYAGKFGGLYLEQEIFDLLKVAADHWGDKFRVLLLTNHTDDEIYSYASRSKLDKKQIIKRFVPHKEIPDYIGAADFAICPMKPLPSRRYSAPIKNSEYWALGLPVIITKNISNDSELILKHHVGYVLSELSVKEYQKAITLIDELISNNSRAELYARIRPIAESQRNFNISRQIYSSIYGKL